jgi:hypothetical protein
LTISLCLSNLRQQLEQYDDYEITEELDVAKFLRCSPKKYLQLKIAIQIMIGISALTIGELIRRFKAIDDDEEKADEPFSVGGKLHYAIEHCHYYVCRKEWKKG